MTYLVFGPDAAQKETKIAELKKKHLAEREALSFDYDVFDGRKMDPQILRQALLALPVFSPKRFILVRESHKLSEHNRKVIMDFLASGRQDHLVFVLEAEGFKGRDSFFAALKTHAQLIEAALPRAANVFDVTRAMSRHQPSQALKILHGLLSDGQHPLQLLGGLIWFWKEQKRVLSKDVFEDGLRAFQETDLNIKRSRLYPDYALEVLIVRLCRMMSSKTRAARTV